MPKFMKSRFSGLYVFGVLFLAVSLILRVVLCVDSASQADLGVWAMTKVFAVGTFFDLIAYFFIVSPVTLYLLLAPEKLFSWKPLRYVALAIYFLAIYALLFDAASEWFFWDEFGARYNFVAVDYLIYTQEVVGNIQ
ncbi:MAG: sulfatase, partial [Planctomycetaceae bacterium]